jgi:hypothetical protein
MEAAVPRRKTLVRDALLGFILAETISFAFALATTSAHPWMALVGIPYALIFGFIQGTIVGIFHPIALLWPAYNVLAMLIGAVLTAVLLNIDRGFIRVLGFAGFFVAYLAAFVWVVARFLPSPVFTLTSPKPW